MKQTSANAFDSPIGNANDKFNNTVKVLSLLKKKCNYLVGIQPSIEICCKDVQLDTQYHQYQE